MRNNDFQGKRQDQIEYSEAVIFLSFVAFIFGLIYCFIGLWWTLYLCAVGLCMMFLYGASEQNKRYDDAVNKEFEKAHEEYVKEQIGIDTGIIDNESEINNEGKLIYF